MTHEHSSRSTPELILLAGATGYVGGRLRMALERAGHRVRCMARRPEGLRQRVATGTQVVAADCLDPASMEKALAGVSTAYYLVHSMGAPGDFEEQDRRAASNFGDAARRAGVRRIIYLGGLGARDEELSQHLRSRHETGDCLRRGGVEVIEFRASIVIGSGSLSFELIRALVERLPVMVCPRWVSTPAQPIAIEDLIAYLIEALELPSGPSRIFEIGGPDRVSYGDIMQEYAHQRGLHRYMIRLPVLTATLSSLWLGLVTPVYARVGRKLVESLRHPTVVTDDAALRLFRVRPRGLHEAIERALVNEDDEMAATHWSDAISSASRPRTWAGVRFGTRLVDSRAVNLTVSAERAFAAVRRIGGSTGWYYADWLWSLRGLLDLAVGGVGMRRGRRDPQRLVVGDVVDCWRVEAFDPPRRLRLTAEMRLPGRAWLEFEIEPRAGGGSTLRQTAIFDPVGLVGLLYWYGIYPLHELVFQGMLDGLARAASVEPRDARRTHDAGRS